MGVALACAWQPRGEIDRFRADYPALVRLYSGVVVVAIPGGAEPAIGRGLRELPDCQVITPARWASGRLAAVKAAAERADHVHYVDLDRLVRWRETVPDEPATLLPRIGATDCLIIGRTAGAMATHP